MPDLGIQENFNNNQEKNKHAKSSEQNTHMGSETNQKITYRN